MKKLLRKIVTTFCVLGMINLPVLAEFSVTYEAEVDAVLSNAEISTQHIDFSGDGFVDFGGAGSSVMWEKVEVPASGAYILSFRYANGTGPNGADRQCIVEVNGKKLEQELKCATTDSWYSWYRENITAELIKGINTVKVISIGEGPNLDNLFVTDGEPPGEGSTQVFEAEQVVVDFSTEKDQINHLVGFLHGFDHSNSIPDEFITSIKTKYHRVGPGQAVALAERSKRLGVTVMSVLSDGWGYKGDRGWPGDRNNWREFDRFITQHYNDIIKAGYNLKDIHFDIWNEANGISFWNPEDGDVVKNRERFNEAWIYAYKKLKELNPESIVEGPSLSDIWYRPVPGDVPYPFMTAWIDAVIEHDAVPDYLTWHFPGDSAHWNSQASTDPAKEIADVRALFEERGVECPPIIINEYLYKEGQNPGVGAYHLSQFHRMDVYGACHAIWGTRDELDQIIVRDADGWAKKGEYWLYERYATMEGMLTETEKSTNIDLIASKDSDTRMAYVMVGNRGKFIGDLTVKLDRIYSSAATDGEQARIKLEKISYNDNQAVAQPEILLEDMMPVKNNAIEIPITYQNPLDAYFITIGPGSDAPARVPVLESGSKNNGKDGVEDTTVIQEKIIQGISVVVNGKFLDFTGEQSPFIAPTGRTLIPLRKVFEALDAKVAWDDSTQTITVQKGDTVVAITVGVLEAIINGEAVVLDQPAEIVNQRTMIPLRFVGQAFGGKVEWYPDTQRIEVTIVT